MPIYAGDAKCESGAAQRNAEDWEQQAFESTDFFLIKNCFEIELGI